MFCDEVLELVDAIASGDIAPDARLKAHFASCAGCAAALDAATRVDRLLRERTVPTPPADLSARVMGRIRRERWRRDQFIDAGFNLVVTSAALGVVATLWFIVSRSGMGGMAHEAVQLLNGAAAGFFHRIAPSLPVFVGAFALVAAALGVWWWAERDAPL